MSCVGLREVYDPGRMEDGKEECCGAEGGVNLGRVDEGCAARWMEGVSVWRWEVEEYCGVDGWCGGGAGRMEGCVELRGRWVVWDGWLVVHATLISGR